MAEYERLLNINSQLSRESEKEERQQRSIELMTKRVNKAAQEEVERYVERNKKLAPVALEKIESTIQPFFNSLIETGVFSNLLSWAKRDRIGFNGNDVQLSNSILYSWPKKALANKDNKMIAEIIIESKSRSEEDAFRSHTNFDEVWRAGFHINDEKGLHISRWPGGGGSYAFAVGMARGLEIKVDHRDISLAMDLISPEVWIGFANQVEDGTAISKIEDSLKPRVVKIPVSGSNYRADMMRLVEIYRVARDTK